MSRWERHLWCWLVGHRLIVWQEFSSYARRIKCEHCGGDWAMNDRERAFCHGVPTSKSCTKYSDTRLGSHEP